MRTVSDVAHAREYSWMDRERRRRDALTPNACVALTVLGARYVMACSKSGSQSLEAQVLLAMCDYVLDEKSEGRDIPAEVADSMEVLSGDR